MTSRLLPSSMLALLALAGCTGGSTAPASSPSNGSTGPTSSTNQSPSNTLRSLVAAGTLPTLDVTTSLGGTDADKNGIRDDLDKYIAALPDDGVQKKALLQLAAAVQTTLSVDPANASQVAAVSSSLNNAVSCTFQQYPGGNTAQNKAFLVEELTMNTLPRITAYEKYNSALNGAIITLPTGTVCK
jgi:hypothetical protein